MRAMRKMMSRHVFDFVGPMYTRVWFASQNMWVVTYVEHDIMV
jgi:hypothetical protein